MLVSLLYLFSCINFSKKFSLEPGIFYVVSLTPFLLLYGFSVGTELLSLSLVLLFFAYYNSTASGFFLALAYLARYTNILFIPFILLNKKPKRILLCLLLFSLVVSPWFLFNYAKTGNLLTSYINSYAMNIKFRDYIHEPVNIQHLINVGSYLWILFFVGLVIEIKNIKKEILKKAVEFTIMILAFIFIVYSYAKIPIKIDRYLFNLIMPLSYFSAIAIEKINKKVVYIAIILSITTIYLAPQEAIILEPSSIYQETINETRDKIKDCALISNAWVHLNYLGIPAEPFVDKRIVKHKIDKGYIILLFKHIPEPSYTFDKNFTGHFSTINETSSYILLGNNSCKKKGEYDESYIKRVSEVYKIIRNETFSISPYELFFTKKSA